MGKDGHWSSDTSISEHTLLKLMFLFVNKGRNVTMGNFFTSIKLAKTMIHKKTSVVGTMNLIRRGITAEVKTMKEAKYETKLFIQEDATWTVY